MVYSLTPLWPWDFLIITAPSRPQDPTRLGNFWDWLGMQSQWERLP